MALKLNLKKALIWTLALSSLCTVATAHFFSKKVKVKHEIAAREKVQTELRAALNQHILGHGSFPEQLQVGSGSYRIGYTFQDELNDYIKKLLKQYRSDFSSIVVIDNNTGAVLAAAGYRRDRDKFDNDLVFSASHPSASIFKIVTTAELLERAGVGRNSTFPYTGRATTLYRTQLRDPANNRWTRYQTLERAFAVSNNVVFGKAAIKKLTGAGITQRAEALGFNQQLMAELDLGPSHFSMPEDQYNLAEIASGFNTSTMMGPIHGALLSSIIANDGLMRYPRVVSDIVDESSGQVLNLFERGPKQVLDHDTARDLAQMMKQTVIQGTARMSFRRSRGRARDFLEIGGKTGSITGGVPYGKRDWFTAFARPKDAAYGKGISVCVMNINVNRWYVKSTFLAKDIIEFYFDKIYSSMDNLNRNLASKKISKSDF